MKLKTFKAIFHNNLEEALQFEAASNASYLVESPSWEAREFLEGYAPSKNWQELWETHGQNFSKEDVESTIELLMEQFYLPDPTEE